MILAWGSSLVYNVKHWYVCDGWHLYSFWMISNLPTFCRNNLSLELNRIKFMSVRLNCSITAMNCSETACEEKSSWVQAFKAWTLTIQRRIKVMKRASVLPVANKSFLNLDPFQHLSNNSPTFLFFKTSSRKLENCGSPSMLWGQQFSSTLLLVNFWESSEMR